MLTTTAGATTRIVMLVLLAVCGCTARAPAAADADVRALVAHEWELVRLGSQPIPQAPRTAADSAAGAAIGQRPTIRFSAAPRSAGGRSVCNHYGTTYEIRGDSIQFGLFQSTLVGCGDADSIEGRFFRVLGHTQRFAVDATRLILIAEDGTQLEFRPTGR